jgi:hypothetical protein
VAHYLQAESLAMDFDNQFDERDLVRLRQLPQRDDLRVLLARGHGDALRYPGAGPSALLLSPFVRFGGLWGAFLATALALVCAMGLAAGTMRRRLHTPWGLLLLVLFGSVVIRYVLEPRPEVLLLAAVVAAFSLTYRGETGDVIEMPEVYDQAYRQGGRAFALRWGAIGLLLSVVAIEHPVYLLLLVPAGLAAPEASRRSAWLWMGVGTALVLLISVLMSGGISGLPWVGERAIFSARGGFGNFAFDGGVGAPVASPVDAASPQVHLGLWAWNLLFVAAGRTVGALPYFLPLLILLTLWEPRGGRSPLVVTAGAMVLLSIVIWPFDFAGEPGALGNLLLLPLFGALWLVPTRGVRPLWLMTLAVAAGVFLYPTWLQALGLRTVGGAASDDVSQMAVQFLPVESTVRTDDRDLKRSGAVSVRLLGGGVSEHNGQLTLEGQRWGDLLVISPLEIGSLVLTFDGQAGTELEVGGAELGNTLFQADGQVAFEILLAEKARKHPIWLAREDHWFYDLRVRLPKAPPYDVIFSVAADRSTGF